MNLSIVWWAWLFPLTYVIHIAEEFWAGEGYTARLARQKGVHLSATRFFALTGFGLSMIILGILLANTLNFPQFLLTIFGSLVLANGLSHTLTAAIKFKYNPGLISAILLWIPLGIMTIWLLKATMNRSRFTLAVLIGLAIQVTVSFLASRGGNFKAAKLIEP